MITALIVTLTLLAIATLVLIALPAIFYPRALALVFPLLALAWFIALVDVPNKMGYAVDSSLIPDGTRAQVLQMYQATNAVYALLLFDGASEPKMVSFIRTDESEDQLKKMMDQAAKGPTYINFGDKQQGPEQPPGEGGQEQDGGSLGFTVEGYDGRK